MENVYKNGMLSLINLERALRKGKTPRELGAHKIQAGTQKAGYLYTVSSGKKYVVKLNSGGCKDEYQKRPPNLTKYGCATIYQSRAGHYLIQEYVTPLKMRMGDIVVSQDHPAWQTFLKISQNEKGGDYHAANFGIREDGTLVCFDW